MNDSTKGNIDNIKPLHFRLISGLENTVQELTYLSPTAIICLGGDARDHFDRHAEPQTSKEILLNDQKVKIHFLHHPQYIKQWKRKEMDNYVDTISTIIKSCIA